MCLYMYIIVYIYIYIWPDSWENLASKQQYWGAYSHRVAQSPQKLARGLSTMDGWRNGGALQNQIWQWEIQYKWRCFGGKSMYRCGIFHRHCPSPRVHRNDRRLDGLRYYLQLVSNNIHTHRLDAKRCPMGTVGADVLPSFSQLCKDAKLCEIWVNQAVEYRVMPYCRVLPRFQSFMMEIPKTCSRANTSVVGRVSDIGWKSDGVIPPIFPWWF